MQQAFNEIKRNQQEPASSGLRVVHSSRKTEKQELPDTIKGSEQHAPAKTAARYGIKTHYGRWYHPDGPAGNYSGL
jgi:hypothetical protein